MHQQRIPSEGDIHSSQVRTCWCCISIPTRRLLHMQSMFMLAARMNNPLSNGSNPSRCETGSSTSRRFLHRSGMQRRMQYGALFESKHLFPSRESETDKKH